MSEEEIEEFLSQHGDIIDEIYNRSKKSKCFRKMKEDTLNGITKKDSEEIYWYISDDGIVTPDIYENISLYESRLSVGNVFVSEEGAKFEVGKRKVLAELKPFSRPFIYGLKNYYIYTIGQKTTLSYNHSCYDKRQGELYFISERMAERAVKAVGEDRIRKYLFN